MVNEANPIALIGRTFNVRGLRDWIAQRISAVLIGIYTIFLFVYCFSSVSYSEWISLFHSIPMRIATFLVVLCIIWHAWIGIWTVLTDYVKNPIQLILRILVILYLAYCLIWTLQILWG